MSDERPSPDAEESTPAVRPSPKRGAFPSPQSEIEQATPFDPDAAPDEPEAPK